MTPTPFEKAAWSDPTVPPPPKEGPAFHRLLWANNPLKRPSQSQEGYPHEDGNTPPRGGVSGEEAPQEKEVGSHIEGSSQVFRDRKLFSIPPTKVANSAHGRNYPGKRSSVDVWTTE
jgi:hypothetical protein